MNSSTAYSSRGGRINMNGMNWDDLRFFTALVECGTATAAAKRLQVNYATVSRRIERLEDALQQRLFERRQEGFIATVEGQLLYQKSCQIRDDIDSLAPHFGVAAQQQKSIVLSMVPALAEYLVLPHLSQLQGQFPDLKLEIELSNRNVSIPKKEADIALRLSLPESGDYLCKKIGMLNYCLCGNAQWLDKLKQAEPVNVISYGPSLSHLPEAEYLLRRFGVAAIRLQTNSLTSQRIAAEHGYGIALLPSCCLVGSNLLQLPLSEPLQREVWMLTSRQSSQMRATRRIIRELESMFGSFPS